MPQNKHRIPAASAVVLGLTAPLCACGGTDQQQQAANTAAAPEPLPPPQDLAADAELANQAAEAEALDAQIGGNATGAEPNMQ